MAEAFLALWAKKELVMLFRLTLGNFWCSVVNSVTISRNLNNFEKIKVKIKKIKKKKTKNK